MTKEELREMLAEVCDENSRIDREKHMMHHVYIEECLQAAKDRREMYKEITKAAIQWSVIAILGGCWVWLKSNWKAL